MARLKSRFLKPLNNQSGQSIILVSIMVLSFIMFFMFTLNTGLLIHAKISVQAAADAAAYSGAATQGRQLNAISYLNYDMRRQYKKFLFRQFFTGSLGSPFYPKTAAQLNPGPPPPTPTFYDFPKYDYSTSLKRAVAFGAPILCIPLVVGGSQDSCSRINQANLAGNLSNDPVVSAALYTSQIINALVKSIEDTQGIMNKLCVGQGAINLAVWKGWLFRGETNTVLIDELVNGLYSACTGSAAATNPACQNGQKERVRYTLRTLMKGLGLYPRNIINYMRIKTLAGFVNEPRTTVDLERVQALEKASSAEAHERTILAYKSALANLNTSVFEAGMTSMEELQANNSLDLQLIESSADTFIQVLKSSNASDVSAFCQSAAKRIGLKNIPLGVKSLDIPGKKVTYAVKLKAYVRPRGLLYAPWSEPLELDAVAGAKPFGSRIGPAGISGSSFYKTKNFDGVQMNGVDVCDQSGHNCNIPNLEIGMGMSYFDLPFLTELQNIAGMGSGAVTPDGIEKAQYHAMAPTPNEIGGYTILPPPPPWAKFPPLDSGAPQELQYIRYFDQTPLPGTGTPANPYVYRFYAPLYPKSQADVGTLIDQALDATLPSPPGGVPDADGFDSGAVKAETKSALMNYIQNVLLTGVGSEYQETETFAAIELPMSGLIDPPSGKPYWLTKPEQVMSSWAPDYVHGIGFAPRFGYSVRFVALHDLMNQGVVDPDSEFDPLSH